MCVLRVERQSSGLLITMITSTDVAADRPDVVQRFADAASALVAVAGFLEVGPLRS